LLRLLEGDGRVARVLPESLRSEEVQPHGLLAEQQLLLLLLVVELEHELLTFEQNAPLELQVRDFLLQLLPAGLLGLQFGLEFGQLLEQVLVGLVQLLVGLLVLQHSLLQYA